MKINFVYIVFGNMDEARSVGKELVSKRLAACVNIIDNMSSMYWWENEIQDDTEIVLIAKTKEELVPDLIAKVKSMHSYECPCIASFPIADGNKAFLDWVRNETIKRIE